LNIRNLKDKFSTDITECLFISIGEKKVSHVASSRDGQAEQGTSSQQQQQEQQQQQWLSYGKLTQCILKPVFQLF